MNTRKAERLLNLIVCLLEAEQPVTAQRLQDTIPGYTDQTEEAFRRMFERDKEALREVGIPLDRAPVIVEGEPGEGYRIPKERYYLPDLELSPEEVAALWLAAGLVRLQDPADARVALLKLAGDLPPDLDRTRLSWLSADLGLQVPGLARAFEAVADRRRVSFPYPGRAGPAVRTIEPYGLVHRKGAWYLVGHDLDRGARRSFRLDRIAGEIRFPIGAAGRPDFAAPEGFRPEEALELPPFVGRAAPPGDAGEGATTEATVAFDPSTAWWVERTHPWLRLESDGAGGRATARVPVVEESGFLSWVLSLGEGVELLGPAPLRAALRARLEELC
ncbi:MAG TPA: WYL domain-containing protein [Actinomycetota bacterium]|nr:WYL domain-containing protein [Actinomycetota bacterium]